MRCVFMGELLQTQIMDVCSSWCMQIMSHIFYIFFQIFLGLKPHSCASLCTAWHN